MEDAGIGFTDQRGKAGLGVFVVIGDHQIRVFSAVKADAQVVARALDADVVRALPGGVVDELVACAGHRLDLQRPPP